MIYRIMTLLLGAMLLVAGSAFAQDTAPIEFGQTIVGDAAEATQYTFTGEAGTLVTISLSSEDFDTLVELLEADGTEVGRDDDGGSGLNSLLTIDLPNDGVYTINVRSFGGPVDSGTFTLSLSTTETTPIASGESTTVTLEGEAQRIFNLEGMAGDVFNITAIAADDSLDTRLDLNAPDGTTIREDDDSGEGANPALIRARLPQDGTYQIVLASFGGDAISGDVTLNVEATEALSLNEGPQTVTFSDELTVDYMVFEAEAGQTYRVTITSDTSSRMDLTFSDPANPFVGTVNASEASRLVVDISYLESQIYDVRLRGGFFFAEPQELTVTIEPVE